ncbi:DNA-binding response regulator [Labrys miyagiensis]|uniref:DNA-binding response regulator n=1 Tax=Labrys miyagiensis TaxID=346912 RepID=A0ABQ6CAH8_9HYPH|nr:response regulator transcription factor [Labrys miyagiensis]GLS17199.1 DNA-binding response regulator [Labrys miyagiensis]
MKKKRMMQRIVKATSIQLVTKRSLMRDCMEAVLSSAFSREAVDGFATLSDWFRASGGYNPRQSILILDQGAFEQLQTVYHGPKCEMPQIIVISDYHNAGNLAQASRLSVKGWISTRDGVDAVVAATRVAMSGGIFVPTSCEAKAEAAAAVNCEQVFGASGHFGRLSGATPRQLAIIEAVGLGLSNAEIAARLRLRKETVKAHLRSLMKRLCVKTAASLASVCEDLVKHSSKMQARRRFRVELERMYWGEGLRGERSASEQVTYH